MKNKELGKHVKIILKEMCKVVGADHNKIDFKEHNWFYKYEWTHEEENKFKDWMINYLKENAEARNEMLTVSSKNKKILEKAVAWWIFDYGWKVKDDPNLKE